MKCVVTGSDSHHGTTNFVYVVEAKSLLAAIQKVLKIDGKKHLPHLDLRMSVYNLIDNTKRVVEAECRLITVPHVPHMNVRAVRLKQNVNICSIGIG